jgi:predicted nucleotidyltransferase
MPVSYEEYSKYLDILLKDFINILRDELKDNLTSVILYGISKKDASHLQSDIDLLIICKSVPHSKWERYDLIMKLLSKLEPKVEELYQKIGIYVYLSPVLKSQKEASHIDKSYFDLIKNGKILLDRNDFFKKIIKTIEDLSKKLPF